MIAFLVPRRSDGGHRDRLWAWLRHRWERETGWPVYEGHHDFGKFNCSAAINRAADNEWDVGIIAGSDLVVPTPQLHAAVARAQATGELVHAHNHYYYLSESATEEVLNGSEPHISMAEWSQPLIGNGPVAITRELWERVGGYDEGFVGWGFEDVAFRLTCERAAGESNIPGPNFHLWHPVASDATNDGASPENRARYIEYLEGKR